MCPITHTHTHKPREASTWHKEKWRDEEVWISQVVNGSARLQTRYSDQIVSFTAELSLNHTYDKYPSFIFEIGSDYIALASNSQRSSWVVELRICTTMLRPTEFWQCWVSVVPSEGEVDRENNKACNLKNKLITTVSTSMFTMCRAVFLLNAYHEFSHAQIHNRGRYSYYPTL